MGNHENLPVTRGAVKGFGDIGKKGPCIKNIKPIPAELKGKRMFPRPVAHVKSVVHGGINSLNQLFGHDIAPFHGIVKGGGR